MCEGGGWWTSTLTEAAGLQQVFQHRFPNELEGVTEVVDEFFTREACKREKERFIKLERESTKVYRADIRLLSEERTCKGAGDRQMEKCGVSAQQANLVLHH